MLFALREVTNDRIRDWRRRWRHRRRRRRRSAREVERRGPRVDARVHHVRKRSGEGAPARDRAVRRAGKVSATVGRRRGRHVAPGREDRAAIGTIGKALIGHREGALHACDGRAGAARPRAVFGWVYSHRPWDWRRRWRHRSGAEHVQLATAARVGVLGARARAVGRAVAVASVLKEEVVGDAAVLAVVR